jgi:mRNA guanylyltransferase
MLSGLFFPHHEDPRRSLGNTLIDGELVFDTDPRTKKQTLRFLAFDGLVVDNQNIMGRTLDKRYGVSFFIGPCVSYPELSMSV